MMMSPTLPWEDYRFVFPAIENLLVLSDPKQRYMYKSEADAWNREKKELDEAFRAKMKEVLVHKGKSQVFNKQKAVSKRYTMDSLLSHDHPLTYQNFVAFENMLSAEEKEELDKDCFLTIHECRLFGEYNLAMKTPVTKFIEADGPDGADADQHEAAP